MAGKFTVYLIHFERPYVSPGPNPKRISHYIGATRLALADRVSHDTGAATGRPYFVR